MQLMPPLTRIGSLEVAKLVERNQIGPFECDRQNTRLITFNVLLPLSERFLWAIYTVDAGDKSEGCRDRYI